MQHTIGVAVVGYGYWGPNLVRNFVEAEGADLRWVCDLDEDRLAAVRKRYPGVRTTIDFQDVLADGGVDACCLATPTTTHFQLAQQALESGRHVLVEKPICESSRRAEELIDLADRKNRILMVDHTFVYTPAVRCIRSIIESGRLGRILYFDSTRVNLGLFQRDVNVLWDLAVHDLAILDYLLPQCRAVAVSATGISHIPGQPENMAYLTCFYEENLVSHVHANWLAPVKLRRTLIGGERQMIVYEDLEPSDRVKVYDKGIDVADSIDLRINYRSGDCWCPKIPTGEALQAEVAHFLECIRDGLTPLTDGWAGWRCLKIMEAASESMALRGQPVDVAWPSAGRGALVR